jgi:two-component system nitrogen regulation response regulator GlnG
MELDANAPAAAPEYPAALGEAPSQGTDPRPPHSLAAAMERHLAALFQERGGSLPPPGLYHRILREIEYPLLSAALAATRGNQIKAAELLGLNRNTLRKKVRDLDVKWMRAPR